MFLWPPVLFSENNLTISTVIDSNVGDSPKKIFCPSASGDP